MPHPVDARAALFLALLLGGCAAAADDDDSAPGDDDDSTEPLPDPLTFPVDAEGPYRAGWRGWDITYTPVGGTGPRTIGFNVWYPTEDEAGETVRYMDTFLDEESLGGATPAPPLVDGQYPVMVYSHGFQGWGGTSADLCRWFASHGWVVVAPDHTGNTLLDHSDPLETLHYLAKPQDVSAALDTLEDLPSSDPLAGLADTSRVLLSGHSFGVYAVWAGLGGTYDADSVANACAGGGGLPAGECTADEQAAFTSGALDEPRVVAGVALAGSIRRAFFGAEGHRSIHGPLLAMSGSEDPVGAQQQWDTVDQIDLTWIDIEGACHQTFALGSCDTLDAEVGFQIVNTWALAFGRAHVLGDDSVSGILDGTEVVSELVTYQRKTE